MCAIFGIVGEKNFDLLNKMSKSQIFRGPDNQFLYDDVNYNFSFGNNRLAVIDEEGGVQPMYSENKNFLCVFNGTIYNFKEIKDYLIKKNITFYTNSDTEVIVNAFQEFGPKCFNYFDGMWAVAIFNKVSGKLIISRDYLGQKPLFFEKQKNKILFSSQIEGILIDKSYLRNINFDEIQKFYFLSGIRPSESIFKSIKQVTPGTYIEIDTTTLQSKEIFYWDLRNGPDHNIFFKNDLNLDFIEKIIEQHSISDIFPSNLLSSGIDSYLVSKKILNINNLATSYTLGYNQSSFDETSYMKKGYEIFNLKKHFLKDKEYHENLKVILGKIDHPCGDSSLLPTYSIINKITKTKTVIGGDGGDEAFMGYIIFNALSLSKFFKKIPNKINYINFLLVNCLPSSDKYMSFNFKLKKFFKSISSNQFYLKSLWMSSLDIKEINEIFGTCHSEDYFNEEFVFDQRNIFRDAQLFFYKQYLPSNVLFKTDFASMLNSKEYRSPLLSKRIINFSLSQDPESIFSFFKKKKILYKNFKNFIPKQIFSNRKHGFAFPRNIIFKNKGNMNYFIKKNIINIKFFEKKMNEHMNSKFDNGQYLWNELILSNVLENNNVT